MTTLTEKKELIYSRVEDVFDELSEEYDLEMFCDAFGDAIGQFMIDCDAIIEEHQQALIDTGAAACYTEPDTGFRYMKYNQEITNEV